MEAIKQSVWWFIKLLKFDEFLSSKTRQDSFWRIAIPRYRAYKPEKFEYSISPNLKIIIDRSDYTQWRVFSGKLFINKEILNHVKGKKTLTLIDIGANIGAFSIMLANSLKNRSCDIHLFEPNPGVLATLHENVNRLKKSSNKINATVSDCAIGEKEDVLKLNIVKGHSGIATLGKQDSIDETVDVKVISLDQYVKENNLTSLDFLKIDVESYEPSVFHGAKETLTRFKPVLYFEYSHEWFDNFETDYIEEVVQFLMFNGYTFYRESKSGTMVRMAMTIEALKDLSHANFLAIAKSVISGQ